MGAKMQQGSAGMTVLLPACMGALFWPYMDDFRPLQDICLCKYSLLCRWEHQLLCLMASLLCPAPSVLCHADASSIKEAEQRHLFKHTAQAASTATPETALGLYYTQVHACSNLTHPLLKLWPLCLCAVLQSGPWLACVTWLHVHGLVQALN